MANAQYPSHDRIGSDPIQANPWVSNKPNLRASSNNFGLVTGKNNNGKSDNNNKTNYRSYGQRSMKKIDNGNGNNNNNSEFDENDFGNDLIWQCVRCSTNNNIYVLNCVKCQTPRPSGIQAAASQASHQTHQNGPIMVAQTMQVANNFQSWQQQNHHNQPQNNHIHNMNNSHNYGNNYHNHNNMNNVNNMNNMNNNLNNHSNEHNNSNGGVMSKVAQLNKFYANQNHQQSQSQSVQLPPLPFENSNSHGKNGYNINQARVQSQSQYNNYVPQSRTSIQNGGASYELSGNNNHNNSQSPHWGSPQMSHQSLSSNDLFRYGNHGNGNGNGNGTVMSPHNQLQHGGHTTKTGGHDPVRRMELEHAKIISNLANTANDSDDEDYREALSTINQWEQQNNDMFGAYAKHTEMQKEDEKLAQQLQAQEKAAAAAKEKQIQNSQAPANGDGWQCSVCTFVNQIQWLQCDMCGEGVRPEVYNEPIESDDDEYGDDSLEEEYVAVDANGFVIEDDDYDDAPNAAPHGVLIDNQVNEQHHNNMDASSSDSDETDVDFHGNGDKKKKNQWRDKYGRLSMAEIPAQDFQRKRVSIHERLKDNQQRRSNGSFGFNYDEDDVYGGGGIVGLQNNGSNSYVRMMGSGAMMAYGGGKAGGRFSGNQRGNALLEPTKKDFQDACSDIAFYCTNPTRVYNTLRSVTKKLYKGEKKYRTLDTTNPKVIERLLGFEGVLDFLMLLGFESDLIGAKMLCDSKPKNITLDMALEVIKEYKSKFNQKKKKKMKKNKRLSSVENASSHDNGDNNDNGGNGNYGLAIAPMGNNNNNKNNNKNNNNKNNGQLEAANVLYVDDANPRKNKNNNNQTRGYDNNNNNNDGTAAGDDEDDDKDDDDDDDDIDGDSLTLKQLIIWGTMENVRFDWDTMKTLLLTHKTFTTSLDVMKELKRRFWTDLPIPKDKNGNIDIEAQKENDKILRERRLKVIQILQEWIKNYWSEDFEYFDMSPNNGLSSRNVLSLANQDNGDIKDEKTNDETRNSLIVDSGAITDNFSDNPLLRDEPKPKNNISSKPVLPPSLLKKHQSQNNLKQSSHLREIKNESTELREEFLSLITEMKDPKQQVKAPYLSSFSKLIQDKYDIVYKEYAQLRDNQRQRKLRGSVFQAKMRVKGDHHDSLEKLLVEPDWQSVKLGGPSATVLQEMRENELSQQLTLICYRTFRSIQPREFVGKAWASKPPLNQQKAPKLCEMINQFQQITAFVQMKILEEKNLKSRTKAIKKFIKMCELLRDLNNYHALYAVFGALQANSIHRLKDAWQRVLKEKKYSAKMDSLKVLFNMDFNQRNLRNEIRKTTSAVIPYIGIYLKDLTFIEDGNKDKMQDPRTEVKSKMVNFNKCVRVSERVREIYQKAQRPPYDVQPNYIIQKAIIEELRAAEKFSDEDIWNLSSLAKDSDAKKK